MGMYAVDTADPAELALLGNAARNGRAAAALRRRALSQGKQALNGGGNGAAAVNGADALPAAENLHANGAGAPPVASNGHDPSNGTQEVPRETGGANDGVAAAHFGRNVSKERRRQLSLGKLALKGADAPPVASNGPRASNGEVASNGTQEVRRETAAAGDGVAAAHFGRNVSKERRRQLSLGKQALKGADAPPVASKGHGTSNGTQEVPRATAGPSDGVAAAHFGRNVSKERRRQLSLGKQALKGADAPPVASNGPRASNGEVASKDTQEVLRETAGASDGLAAAHFGRNVSKERRRQLSQGKQALSAGTDLTAAAAGAGTGAPAPDPEKLNVDVARLGREQARARRAEASRVGSAAIRHVPKVIVSPTHGDQRVTGLRIGQGEQVTGDEPGAALPVTGTQYVAADGPPPAPGAGPKVGRVRTPKGLVVSGTTVRGTVPITGDEAGEHLRITGEADQKFGDDLTPRPDGTYRATQFPRRADPHGATAVGTTLGVQPQVAEPSLPLENTTLGLPVTGTAVGRSGRVTGNEAGACRPITGDQYQHLSAYVSECGGIGGGTAPAAHLNRGRLDPVTGGKVSMAETWGGQRVTGPSVEYRPNVTGDEPGSCRSVTGTPYQGPATVLGWCEPEEGQPAADRLESRPPGVAVTGDLPLNVKNVTGTERGHRNDITGSSYYGEMRPAEPVGDDAATWQGFSVPVALARRLTGRESGDARKETEDAPPASCRPGSITGSFAVGAGMVTGNNEFLFRPRLNVERRQPIAVTGEGEVAGRPITGSAAAWTHHDLVTGTEGYIAAGRNPTERGGGTQGWAGATRFKNLATPGAPPGEEKVTGRVGGSPKAGARVTVSGGAQG